MLLPVTFAWDERGFTIVVVDLGELKSEVANKIRGIEDMAYPAFSKFIHGRGLVGPPQ